VGLIPGGSQVVSKRSERFLPDGWPDVYFRCKGCTVTDLMGNNYIDFATMGVGACILGYADDDIDDEVIGTIRRGVMCTLNSLKEIKLAEKLIQLHPWAEMVRLAKTGGEACAIAVRLARAATGKSNVAVCGYHGWHDWYLSANLVDSSRLDEHLLKGLEPKGVPQELYNTTLPFRYGDADALEKIVAVNDLAAIIMEPGRSEIDEEFLQAVRRLASRSGIVLIFDEVTSGFRMNNAGLHMKLGIKPDVAVLGKALGNGYPISAVIGKREIMDQDTFISSTMWSEATGTAAALATLDKMTRLDIPTILTHYGELIADGLEEIGLKVERGIPPLLHIVADNTEQTLITQEMLKKGYLFGSSIYSSYAYNENIISKMLLDLTEVVDKVRRGRVKLEGRVRTNGFERLT